MLDQISDHEIVRGEEGCSGIEEEDNAMHLRKRQWEVISWPRGETRRSKFSCHPVKCFKEDH